MKKRERHALIDGAEFDRSYGDGKPASFRADHVIAGWKEALQMMKEGASRMFVLIFKKGA